MEKYDCVIIGGGLSGLAAAARLSHFGRKVLLLEKNANLGGLNSFYHRNGVEIDSGLHAMTNFSRKSGDKSLPLNKLLRQLRIPYDDLGLIEQIQSEIRFPGASLVFDNDFCVTAAKFKALFPASAPGFDALCSFIREFDAFSLSAGNGLSARGKIREFISDRLLEDSILLPLMFYGNACEEDMELPQFVIMFRSIFMEGFCRPAAGIRAIIGILEQKIEEASCEIRRKCAAGKITREGKTLRIALSDGSAVETERIISCAGANETARLCESPIEVPARDGQMSFVEAIFCMKEGFEIAGYRNACMFFNDADTLEYRRPGKAFSTSSGVFCCPDNFKYADGQKPKHVFLRLTALANHEFWLDAPEEEYKKLKEEFREEAFAKIAGLSGLKIRQEDIFFSDVFTPRTILRWSGHANGAIYGSPAKLKDGLTPVENLFICGTDQGFLGISGSILSGISIANKYALQ